MLKDFLEKFLEKAKIPTKNQLLSCERRVKRLEQQIDLLAKRAKKNHRSTRHSRADVLTAVP